MNTVSDYLKNEGKEFIVKTFETKPYSYIGFEKSRSLNNNLNLNKVNDVFRKVYGVEPKSLNVNSRKGMIPIYRHAYRFWVLKYTSFSLTVVGKMSNNSDHSTVMFSRRQYLNIYNQIPELKNNHDLFIELMK